MQGKRPSSAAATATSRNRKPLLPVPLHRTICVGGNAKSLNILSYSSVKKNNPTTNKRTRSFPRCHLLQTTQRIRPSNHITEVGKPSHMARALILTAFFSLWGSRISPQCYNTDDQATHIGEIPTTSEMPCLHWLCVTEIGTRARRGVGRLTPFSQLLEGPGNHWKVPFPVSFGIKLWVFLKITDNE